MIPPQAEATRGKQTLSVLGQVLRLRGKGQVCTRSCPHPPCFHRFKNSQFQRREKNQQGNTTSRRFEDSWRGLPVRVISSTSWSHQTSVGLGTILHGLMKNVAVLRSLKMVWKFNGLATASHVKARLQANRQISLWKLDSQAHRRPMLRDQGGSTEQAVPTKRHEPNR